MFIPNQRARTIIKNNNIIVQSLQSYSTPGIIIKVNVNKYTDYNIEYRGESQYQVVLWIGDSNKNKICELHSNCFHTTTTNNIIYRNQNYSTIYIGFLFGSKSVLHHMFVLQYFNITEVKPSIQQSFIKDTYTILFAGHNFHFIQPLIDYYTHKTNHNIVIDHWSGHNIHNEPHSKNMITQTDIIVCEWCLGNSVWYSEHVQSHQQLYIHFHRMELELDYMHKVKWDQVHSVIGIAPHVIDTLKSTIKNTPITYIPNVLSIEPDYVKKDDSAIFTIGVLGYIPKLKRIDIAIRLYQTYKKKDSRYRLWIMGKSPKEVKWLQQRPAEMTYFNSIQSIIDNDDNITMFPYTNDKNRCDNGYNLLGG